jgi:TolA-binding protein
LGNTDKALPVFTKLASETNSAEGAESKYWLSKILYDQQKFKASEDVIMDFIEKNSPHQYWLAKSFILLADIYSKNGDQFQAKHTLKSVLENYPDTEDGIMETARQQLKVIEEQEALETRNKEKPLEINIGGQKK